MKVWLFVIGMLALTVSVIAYVETRTEYAPEIVPTGRFTVLQKQLLEGSRSWSGFSLYVVQDLEAGREYVVVQSGHGLSITPLLGREP